MIFLLLYPLANAGCGTQKRIPMKQQKRIPGSEDPVWTGSAGQKECLSVSHRPNRKLLRWQGFAACTSPLHQLCCAYE
jgi:hypothetical protein